MFCNELPVLRGRILLRTLPRHCTSAPPSTIILPFDGRIQRHFDRLRTQFWFDLWALRFTSHEIRQLISIYQDLAFVHCQNTNPEDTIHPIVRPRGFELQPGKPLHFILCHASSSCRVDIDSRSRFEDAFGAYVDVMAVVSFQGVSSIQTHELRGVSSRSCPK